jgi:hypothetical protein
MIAKMEGEFMNWRYRLLAVISISFALALFSCSNEKSFDKQGVGAKTPTQQASEAIEGYGKRPIDKARKAVSLGEDRTRDIDEATQNIDRH